MADFKATGISGSLTALTDGTPYLVDGTNITTTIGTNGAITIDAAGGGTMSSFIIRDPAANTSTITDGDTLNFVNTSNETTVAVSGDNVTIGLAATAVTPGSYTSADITIDANG